MFLWIAITFVFWSPTIRIYRSHHTNRPSNDECQKNMLSFDVEIGHIMNGVVSWTKQTTEKNAQNDSTAMWCNGFKQNNWHLNMNLTPAALVYSKALWFFHFYCFIHSLNFRQKQIYFRRGNNNDILKLFFVLFHFRLCKWCWKSLNHNKTKETVFGQNKSIWRNIAVYRDRACCHVVLGSNGSLMNE